jgi:hypothetical protein
MYASNAAWAGTAGSSTATTVERTNNLPAGTIRIGNLLELSIDGKP